MFNPNDPRSVVIWYDPSTSTPIRTGSTRRSLRRVRPNIVRLIPGLTRLPIGYSPR